MIVFAFFRSAVPDKSAGRLLLGGLDSPKRGVAEVAKEGEQVSRASCLRRIEDNSEKVLESSVSSTDDENARALSRYELQASVRILVPKPIPVVRTSRSDLLPRA